jgi:hypothetical protein
MANVVTEHIILMVPVFFVMMIFALIANSVVANYAVEQKAIIVDGAQNQLTTTISQLYFIVNQAEIPNCVVTKTMPLPEMIEGQQYLINGTMAGNVLRLTFKFPGISLSDDAEVTLGPDAQWVASSVHSSINQDSVLRVEKYYNATLGRVLVKFSFG